MTARMHKIELITTPADLAEADIDTLRDMVEDDLLAVAEAEANAWMYDYTPSGLIKAVHALSWALDDLEICEDRESAGRHIEAARAALEVA